MCLRTTSIGSSGSGTVGDTTGRIADDADPMPYHHSVYQLGWLGWLGWLVAYGRLVGRNLL